MSDWNKVESDADAWVPEEEGDEIVGTLVDKDPEGGKHGSGLYTVEDDDGTQRIVFGTMVLNDRLNNVDLGSDVKIVFKGEEQAASGNNYKDFDVFTRA